MLAKLLEAFRSGATRDEAAEAAGVPRRTLFNWLERGELDESGPFRELADEATLTHGQTRALRSRGGKQRGRRRKLVD